MKKFLSTKVKDMNAITLVALVITIVVLIILATVAIQLSLGNNGILNKAKTAKEQYQNATEYEQTETAKFSNSIDSYVENSARAQSSFTKLYGNITTTGSYTLLDSIEKYDKLIFITGNVSNNKYKQQKEFYTNFFKDSYGTETAQFQMCILSSQGLDFHFQNSTTLVVDSENTDVNHKILEIYGVN